MDDEQLTGVVEHDEDVVQRGMDVCGFGYRANGHAPSAGQIPLSMPSAPSRMAASKLASVFSGNAADACKTAVNK